MIRDSDNPEKKKRKHKTKHRSNRDLEPIDLVDRFYTHPKDQARLDPPGYWSPTRSLEPLHLSSPWYIKSPPSSLPSPRPRIVNVTLAQDCSTEFNIAQPFITRHRTTRLFQTNLQLNDLAKIKKRSPPYCPAKVSGTNEMMNSLSFDSASLPGSLQPSIGREQLVDYRSSKDKTSNDARYYMGGKGFSRFLKNQKPEGRISTTTPTAPYSSSDLIGTYHGEGGRLPSSEELRIGNGSLTDRDPRRRSNGEFEKRPNSRGRENKKSFSYNGKVSERETDSRERHKDDGVIFPPANNNNNVRQVTLTNGIKPSGMRNNFLSGQAIPAPAASRNNQLNSQNSKESDDLVAMGTNWHPPPNGQGPGRTSRGSFGAGSQLSHNSNSGLLGPRKITSRTNMGAGAGQNKKDGKLSEPKYADAMTNAPPSFQQRISELSALEQETIRYERTKKFRRKPKES